MLTDKELRLLEELEKNQDVVYLLNTEECEFVSRLISSYREIRRQLLAIQLNQQEDWLEEYNKNKGE
ncbi:MAG: hypothetical protein K0B09_02490 [Bacteroidales bacterium]|nr:hypothetical protein [Bacteroidales bacterium]